MLFGNNCGCNNACCGWGNDTILWFIILFLLIFCGNGSIFGNNCGRNNDCC